jgi:DNA primase
MQSFDVRYILDHYNIYYEEKLSSNDLDIICPFHDDKNLGSTKINEETGLFNCYSCKASGNIFQFVARMEDVSVIEAGKLIENDFELEAVYDIDRLKDKVTKVRIFDEGKEYRILAQKISLKILFEMGNMNLPLDFIYKWLSINMWMLDVPKNNISTKYKQLLNMYSLFINERKSYETYTTSSGQGLSA